MGNHRRLPFGYEMHFGRIQASKEESAAVAYIFQQYCSGASFTELAVYMQSGSIPYGSGNGWNKNTIARILQDDRYMGGSYFPQIITKEVFYKADEIRQRKATTEYPSSKKKILRKLSGCPVSAEQEDRVRRSINWLIQNPTFVVNPNDFSEKENVWMPLQKIDPNDQKEMKAAAFQIAANQYSQIPQSGYETAKIRNLLNRDPLQEMDPELVESIVQRLIWNRKGELCILLTNGQVIGEALWKKEG